jgi:hypothetical protein
MTKEQVELFLDSPEAEAVLTLMAYAVEKTKTEADDEVLVELADYTDLLAEKIQYIAEKQPTDKDAKQAALVILEKIASLTATKWDDLVVSLAKKIL